jgi:hypothetical protein
MQDKFDKYINLNREAFDNDEPPMDMWERIAAQSGIDSKPVRSNLWLGVAKYAAAIVVLALATTLTVMLLRSGNGEAQPALAADSEISETAVFYEKQIVAKQQIIFELTANQPKVREGVEQDLAALDTALFQLKHDLKDNVANAEVLEAMIQNYRLKLAILEEVLGYIEPAKETQIPETHEL